MLEASIDTPQLFGLVLAGGQSSRMGKDKGLIDFYGKPQREYIFELLSKFCVQVFTSCKENANIPFFLNPISDQFKIESPLNGILSAFQKRKDVAWLTLPVDMPLINSSSIEYLIFHRSKDHFATCFFDSEEKNPEPLFTIWEPKAYVALEKFYNSGKVSPRDFLKQSFVKIIKLPDVSVLLNINSPEELQKFNITRSFR